MNPFADSRSHSRPVSTKLLGAPVNNEKLDTTAAIALVIGSILGSGIFIAPSLIAGFSTSIWITSLFWIIGGLACAAGAVIYGGLGLLFPQGGGQYVYLRETMGARYSRLYGWLSMLVICPTMLAGTSLYFSALCRSMVPAADPYLKLISIALLILFTLLNSFGLTLAGSFQKLLVFVHVALFGGVMALSFYFLPGQELHSYLRAPRFTGSTLAKGILALAAVLWTFEGFNAITFITNEIKDGERNIRKIALAGCMIVLVLYLIFNFAVLSNIPAAALPLQSNAASFLMSQVFGTGAAWVVFLLTAFGVATVLHSSAIIGPRVIAATLRDGRLFRDYLRANRDVGAPLAILWFQCVLSVFYVMVGHFEVLITAFAVLNWLFYGITSVGFFRVRLKEFSIRKISSRQFSTDGVCVALFLSIVILLLVSEFIENPRLSLFGLAIFVAGCFGKIPVEFQQYLMRASPLGAASSGRKAKESPEVSSEP